MATIEAYKDYSPLDALNRCGVATACLGPETLPADGEHRHALGHVQPSGWQMTTYDSKVVPGESLYNRTHLIAWALCDEEDNPQNLITGTQQLNQRSMQPLEERVIAYIRRSGNHVLYRVTPVFQGNDLVARGVRMEARSVEDAGVGISFNVYCRNIQPGVKINYRTGESQRNRKAGKKFLEPSGYLMEGPSLPAVEQPEPSGEPAVGAPSYVLNLSTQRFHLTTCRSVEEILVRNDGRCRLTREELIAFGYRPCERCHP